MAITTVQLNEVSGSVGAEIAVDVLGSASYQIVKLAQGGGSVANLVTGSTPLPVTGTVTAPVYVTGSVQVTGTPTVSITGTVAITGATSGTVFVANGSLNVVPQGGSTGITGGSVRVGGSVFITGGSVTTAIGTITTILSGSLNVSNQGGSVSIPGTVNVVASPGDAQQQWGSGSIDVIQVGIVSPTTGSIGTLPVSIAGGTLAAVSGTVTVTGSVTTSATIGTIDTLGSGNVFITGGSVTTSATIGTIDTVGSANAFITGGSVNVRVSGTLPDKARNFIKAIAVGTTGHPIGSVGGTGDYLSHLTIVVGSTDANQVLLADGGAGTISLMGSTGLAGTNAYTIPILAYSRIGPWRLTKGAGCTVLASGVFTE